MQIITVAPIARGVLMGSLTYFTKDTAIVGSVVMVPIRKREVPALVLEVKEVSDAKSTLRSSDYALRKIGNVKPRHIWTPLFIEAAIKTARFSAQGLGETLLALTPKTILDAHLDGTISKFEARSSKLDPQHSTFDPQAIQGDTSFRTEAYRGLARESFARNESVFIVVPTTEDVIKLSNSLGRGIENYTYAFHSVLTKKRLLETWAKTLKEEHAVLVIGTPQYLTIPRYFSTIILDNEHSRAWKTIMRPLIDMRVFAENYAKGTFARLIFGAPILRPETHRRIRDGEIGEFTRISAHAQSGIKAVIINPRIEEKSIKEYTGKRTVQILSEQIRTLITTAQTNNESVLLICARKGLSPITACGDCGTVIKCPECTSPLVIHHIRGGTSLRALAASNVASSKKDNAMIFSCHSCGFMRVPENDEHETCPTCHGWRLEALGIGIDRIYDEVAKHFPDASSFVFDGDRIKTPSQARKLVEQFEKSEIGILIATPMAIPYLSSINHTAIISIDSLFAIPDFRMNERIFAIILALREKTKQTLLIQTRADDTTLITQALAGDLAGFTDDELSVRKIFSYPPYGTIIKVTLRGGKAELPEELARLKEFLSEYHPITPNTISKEPSKIFQRKTSAGDSRNIFRMHIIIKLKEGAWPDEKLLAKLRTLPPQFTTEVNPDHLL